MNTERLDLCVDGWIATKVLAFGHCPATYTPHDFAIAVCQKDDGVDYIVKFSRRTHNIGYMDPHGDGGWHEDPAGYPFPTMAKDYNMGNIVAHAKDSSYGGSDNGHGECHVCQALLDIG